MVVPIFGTGDNELSQIEYSPSQQKELLPNKPTLLLQQDDEGHQDHAVDEAPQQVKKANNGTLQQDHAE